MFDPNEFLQETYEGSHDTKLINPEDNMAGDGYQALIKKVDIRSWQKKDDPSVAGLALDLQWEILDEDVKRFCNRDVVIVKQGIMLDLTDAGRLDMARGKNVALGRLREALDMNQDGQPFSFSMLEGSMANVFVQHRIHDDNIYAEVKRVAKL